MVALDPQTEQVLAPYLGKLGLIGTLVVGVSAGVVAKLLMPKKASGVVVTVLLGVAGSGLASFFARRSSFYPVFDTRGVVVGLGGAFAVLILYRIILCRNQ